MILRDVLFFCLEQVNSINKFKLFCSIFDVWCDSFMQFIVNGFVYKFEFGRIFNLVIKMIILKIELIMIKIKY